MKKFKTFGAVAICALLAPAFTSCGGDDNDEPGSGGVIDIQGERLTSINNSRISYDSEGRVTSISSPYSLNIDYSAGIISLADDEEEGNINVKFNGKGYITELSSSWDYEEKDGSDRYRYTGNAKMRLSYNGSGNLIKIDCENVETEKDLSDNTTEKFKENFTINYEWRDGNMVRAVEEGTENEDGDKYHWTDTYNVEYGNQLNEYLQTPMSLSYIAFDESGLQVLSTVGMFGNGPVMLPDYMEESDDDGYSRSYTLSFKLNSNGSIAQETGFYRTFNYGYSTITRSGNDKAAGKKLHVRDMFVKRAR